jgi:hypothetical protein
MAKQIINWSYWLGAVCTLLALLARAFNALGVHFFLSFSTRGNPIDYRTFLDGAILLFVICIATANHGRVNSRASQP